MDTLAEVGASWFCSAARLGADPGFQMATCGSPTSRYAVGLATAVAVIVLCCFALWRGTASFR